MLRIKSLLFLAATVFTVGQLQAQTKPDNERWQQRCKYFMEIDMNTDKHQFTGTQRLIYYNNSPDEITKVFYHLYFNAFQPGSMMDERSRTIRDPDPRVGSRIAALKEDEIGYHKIKVLKHNGKDVKFHIEETILEVTLDQAIQPGGVDTFYMEFESQVPKQIRRSGRNSKQGIDYSMAQWYPKMSEYDYQGWHANPYVGREFYGIWGDFDVKITLPKKYTVGATGYLQNPNEMGHGYEKVGYKPDLSKVERQTWNFIAPNVHDFVWAADPDYKHDVVDLDDTTQLHFFYQDRENYNPMWQKAQGTMLRAFKFIESRYGDYPYRQYSFIEGGDGGMEYPMATLITGEREYPSLTGVMIHELMHTWFQMLMGSNESLYPWMDEGFTSFSEGVVEAFVYNRLKAHDVASLNTNRGSYAGYRNLAKSGIEEPMSMHSDHYMTNAAYGTAAYSKGCVFITQMSYIVGEKAFDEGMLDYYKNWRFKHPNPNDFIRIMEKKSGLELDWYKEYFVNSTHTIDYGVKDVTDAKKETKVTLERHEWTDDKTGVRHGRMPMPVDIEVEYKDGKEIKKASYYIPLGLMRGEKADEGYYGPRTVLKDWWWTHKTYEFTLPYKTKDIIKITIDPSLRMADINDKDNVWEGK